MKGVFRFCSWALFRFRSQNLWDVDSKLRHIVCCSFAFYVGRDARQAVCLYLCEGKHSVNPSNFLEPFSCRGATLLLRPYHPKISGSTRFSCALFYNGLGAVIALRPYKIRSYGLTKFLCAKCLAWEKRLEAASATKIKRLSFFLEKNDVMSCVWFQKIAFAYFLIVCRLLGVRPQNIWSIKTSFNTHCQARTE